MQKYICKNTCLFPGGSIAFTEGNTYISLDSIGVMAQFIDDQGNVHIVDKKYLTSNFDLDKNW